MEHAERDTETETESDTEPEEVEEHEEETTEEEEIDEEDIELLQTEPTLYTNEDAGYVSELKRTCPPHPLFVLKWNRQPRTPHNNRFSRGSGDQRQYSQPRGHDRQRNNQHRESAQSSPVPQSYPHRQW